MFGRLVRRFCLRQAGRACSFWFDPRWESIWTDTAKSTFSTQITQTLFVAIGHIGPPPCMNPCHSSPVPVAGAPSMMAMPDLRSSSWAEFDQPRPHYSYILRAMMPLVRRIVLNIALIEILCKRPKPSRSANCRNPRRRIQWQALGFREMVTARRRSVGFGFRPTPNERGILSSRWRKNGQ